MLEEAEHWIASRPHDAPMPTPQTQRFVAESRHATSRQRDVLIVSLMAGLVAAVVLVGVAFLQRSIAQSESARATQALEAAEQLANALVLDLARDPQVRNSPELQGRIFDRAIDGYSKVILLNPLGPLTYRDRGNAYLEKGSFAEAVADYDYAIKLSPNDAIAYSNRCWARVLANDDLQQALSDCNKALLILPENKRALDNRGYVYLRLNQFDDAIANFDAVLAIDPRFANSLYGRGLAKLNKNDQEGAEADFAAAKIIRPTVSEELARYGIR